MSSFDFTAYIQGLITAHDSKSSNSDEPAITTATTHTNHPAFVVQLLSGGVTNHTARITFNGPLQDILRVTNVNLSERVATESQVRQIGRTVVLKHAPPYVAADPSQAMSVDRQLLEKKALEILNSKDEGLGLGRLFDATPTKGTKVTSRRKTAMHIPKLIWHDSDQNVLWIEDLGGMRMLSEVLLDDSTFQSDLTGGYGEQTNVQIQQIAADLGYFVGQLYKATANPPKHLIDHLRALSGLSKISDYLTNMVLENLQRPEACVSDVEAEILAERVKMGLAESGEEGIEDLCLGMVDFWPENVIVGFGNTSQGEGGDETSGSPRCGLVDWEYFGSSNAGSELGMFLANLHLHIMNSTTSSKAKTRIQLFADTMLQGYAESQSEMQSSVGFGLKWKPSKRFKRRVLLAHGRELVNGIVMYEGRIDGAAQKRIFQAGVRSLKAAGDSENDIHLEILNTWRGAGSDDDIGMIWQGFVELGFEQD